MLNGSRADRLRRRALVLAAPLAASLPRFRNGFVFDDVFVIERGEFIHDLANVPLAFTNNALIASSQRAAAGTPAMDTYRPLSIGSFFWDAALSGRQPWSYHLTNLLLHALACLLVLELLDRLLPRVAPAFRCCAALCFGLSPWLAEAHVFINGRSDLLLACFLVAALLLQQAALERERAAPSWLAACSLWLALLSKEIAVVLLPFVVLVPTEREVGLRQRFTRGVPLGVALCAYLGMRYLALAGLRTHSDAAQLALALKQLPLLLADGMFHALVPTPYFLRSLRDDYARAGVAELAVCTGVLAALCALAIAGRRRAPPLVWAFFFALAALAPAAMISTVLWPGFGRYLYVPAIGLSLLLAAGLDALGRRTTRRRQLALALGALLVSLAAALLVSATLQFEDERGLYRAALAQRPEQAWAYGFLGMSLRRERHCAEAVAYLNRAERLDPEEPRYATHLGRCLLDLQAYGDALGVARRGRERFRGRRPEAGFLLIEALALPPARGAEQAALLERCVRIDRARTDCAELLETVRAGATAVHSDAARPALP